MTSVKLVNAELIYYLQRTRNRLTIQKMYARFVVFIRSVFKNPACLFNLTNTVNV